MRGDAAGSPLLCFGVFELDPESGELRKSGVLIHLAPQPVKILALLASHPGQLITREEICRHVWGSETFVDSEQGLNHCIKQIRTALGDGAEAARYIQTLPRRGYRFIAPVNANLAPVPSPAVEETHEASGTEAAGTRRTRLRPWMVAVPLLAAMGAAVFLIFTAPGTLGRLRPKPPPPRIESIAVLPIVNLARDPDQEYLADGMTDAFITDLAKIQGVKVISRTSVMHYKGTNKPLPQIARELGVDGVIEGTVQRSGERVRITVQLIRAVGDTHLWAESYEREFRDVLTLQGEVAQAVARAIKATLTPEESTHLARVRPANPEAFEAYLRGQFHWYRLSPEHLDRALSYFQLALEKDPN